MSLTRKKSAELKTSGTVKAANRARVASAAAAQSAAIAAQNAAVAATSAAQNAAVAATSAAQNATSVAQNASGAAKTAASGLSKGLNDKVYTARSWAAPRLDNAAEYCTTTVAPKVSSALRTTARQVRPTDMRKSKRSSILTWSLLGAAVLAGLGAAAVLVRYRYQTAIAADSEPAEEEVTADSTDSQTAPVSPEGTRSPATTPTDKSTDSPVNGRVTATGW
jgi:hypothetical protein